MSDNPYVQLPCTPEDKQHVNYVGPAWASAENAYSIRSIIEQLNAITATIHSMTAQIDTLTKRLENLEAPPEC